MQFMLPIHSLPCIYDISGKDFNQINYEARIVFSMINYNNKNHEIEKKAPAQPELSSRSDFMTYFVVVVRITFC